MSEAWLISYAVLWSLVLMLVFIVVVLARQVGVLHMRLVPIGARSMNAGPDIGSLAPEINTFDIEGRPVRLGGLRDRRTLLLFISPNCPACGEIAPSVKALARSERTSLDVILVSIKDDIAKMREFLIRYGLEKFPCIVSERARIEYAAAAAPYAVRSECKV